MMKTAAPNRGAWLPHLTRCAAVLAAVLLASCRTPYDPGPPLIAESILSIPGYVYSPYTRDPSLVDVRDFDEGMALICPYTGQLFIMPDASPQLPVALGDPPRPLRHSHRVRVYSTPPTRAELSSRTIPAATLPTQELPFGKPVPGRPGCVYSPFADKHQVVDVSGLAPGMAVRCPFTGKVFRVPAE